MRASNQGPETWRLSSLPLDHQKVVYKELGLYKLQVVKKIEDHNFLYNSSIVSNAQHCDEKKIIYVRLLNLFSERAKST